MMEIHLRAGARIPHSGILAPDSLLDETLLKLVKPYFGRNLTDSIPTRSETGRRMGSPSLGRGASS
jgi:hypothetical protein